jgi:hypothetical protein
MSSSAARTVDASAASISSGTPPAPLLAGVGWAAMGLLVRRAAAGVALGTPAHQPLGARCRHPVCGTRTVNPLQPTAQHAASKRAGVTAAYAHRSRWMRNTCRWALVRLHEGDALRRARAALTDGGPVQPHAAVRYATHPHRTARWQHCSADKRCVPVLQAADVSRAPPSRLCGDTLRARARQLNNTSSSMNAGLGGCRHWRRKCGSGAGSEEHVQERVICVA